MRNDFLDSQPVACAGNTELTPETTFVEVPLDWPLHDFRVRDHVRAADGREGIIVGFYRTDPETALILVQSGDQEQVPVTELRLVD